MYRTLIASALLIAVAAAPQNSKNSEITYVKIQPVTEENLPKSPFRESRIENIPLTIPGTVNSKPFHQLKSISKEENNRSKTGQFIKEDIPVSSEEDPSSAEENPLIPDKNPSLHEKNPSSQEENSSSHEKNPSLHEENPSLPEKIPSLHEKTPPSREIDPLIPKIPSDEGPDNQRKTRSEETTDSFENETPQPTDVTESVEPLIFQTEEYITSTKAPKPRFLSKLSYFQKDDKLKSSIATNLVERPGRRTFKSKCRCEKIWNCPKLQITVPRCPNEYFMCCF